MELYEAYAIGKYDGIGHAETLHALAVSKALETHRNKPVLFLLREVGRIFKEDCARYRADINKPVTEDEKRKLLNQ